MATALLCGSSALNHHLRYSAMMDQKHSDEFHRENVGLCSDCDHACKVESSRGSVFLRCDLSASDHSFPKYPRLPVLSCKGYAKKT